MKEIKAYQCEYCGKIYKTKRSAIDHSYICLLDPNNKGCWSCNNLIEDYMNNSCRAVNKKVRQVSIDLNNKTYNVKSDTIRNCKYYVSRDKLNCSNCTYASSFNGGRKFCTHLEDYCPNDYLRFGCPDFKAITVCNESSDN